MKYIIAESKLEETFMNYFDDLFDIQDLNWTYSYEYDDDGNESEDDNRIQFYIGDYEGDDEGCFVWYGCDYFDEGSPAKDICPMISMESQYLNSLNGYFGDMWQETFIKWIDIHFDLQVKTIE